MAHLTLNGVEFETAQRSGDRQYLELGSSDRALDGTYIGTRNRTKREWEIDGLHLSRADADSWAGLLLGRGETYRFIDVYSDKGLVQSAAGGGAVTFNVAAGKFNKRVTLAAFAYTRWTPEGDDALIAGGLNPTGDYTISVWKLTATGPDVWTHYLATKYNGTIATYTNGVYVGAVALTFFFVHSSGYVQLGDGTNAAQFSDMVTLPYAVPAAWVPIYAARTTAFPSIPTIEVSGTLVSSPTNPLNCCASRVRDQLAQTVANVDGKIVSFMLHEI